MGITDTPLLVACSRVERVFGVVRHRATERRYRGNPLQKRLNA